MNVQSQQLSTWAVAGLAVRYNIFFLWRVTILCLKIVIAFLLGAFFNVRLSSLALPKADLKKLTEAVKPKSDADEVLEGEVIDVLEGEFFEFKAEHRDQQAFLRKMGLISENQELWLISPDSGLIPAIALDFKDPLFQWKKAVLKKLGYAWSQEMKLWQVS